MSLNHKILPIIAYGTILLALATMLLFGFWLFYPYNPIEYNVLPYPVLNENHQVRPGQILEYTVDYCKYTDVYPEVIKRYVDGLIYEQPAGRGLVYEGCRVQIVDNLVPSTLLPGYYRMQVIIEYKMNPIRTITYTNETEAFEVLPKE
jgi:hypothetical protein